MLRDMFKKTYTKIDMKYRAGEKESARTAEEDAPVIPAGLWKKCNKCGKPIYTGRCKGELLYLPEVRRILPCPCVPPDRDDRG